MDGHRISMLGTGLIGDFYTTTLHGQRGRDRVEVVYSRSEDRARRSASAGAIPEATTDLEAAVDHPETDVVVVGVPNFLHEEAVGLAAAAGKAVLCTKPSAGPPTRRGGCSRRSRRPACSPATSRTCATRPRR